MTMFGSQWLANAGGGYEIDQSIRFNKSASALMSRTFGTPTDQNKFTYAFWMKPCSESNGYCLETNTTGGVTFSGMVMNGGSMQFFDYTSGSAQIDVRTTFTSSVGKFRDYSAWYHAMFVFDSDQSTDSDRLKFYINGVQFPVADLVGPSGGSVVWPGSGANSKFNASGTVHRISSSVNGLVDGYMADIYFLDGVAATPSDFGKFDSDSNQFVPIEYSGSFGNNGFYIDGRDSSDLGDDESGNGNDFSTSNMGTDDQVTDSPTNNQAIFNTLWKGATLSDGNLVATASGNSYQWATSTIAIDDGGKHVCEFQKSSGTFGYVGIFQIGNHTATTGNNYIYALNLGNGEIVKNASLVTDIGAGAANSLMRIEYDSSADTIKIFDDGTEVFPASTGVSNTVGLTGQNSLHFGCAPFGSGTVITATFSPLSGTPTTGFKELTTTNLSDPTIADGSEYYHNQTYTGNGTSGLAITNTASAGDFKPDILWLAPRSNGDNHVFFDSVRGTTSRIYSNKSDAQDTDGTALITFETDGFDLDTTDPNYNGSGRTYVAWQWHTTGGTSGSNGDGDITSTVSANTTAGFSALTYTGNGSDNQEIGHGLGIAPKMICTKRRDSSGNWTSYHDAVGINQVFYLNSTALPTSNTEQYRAVPTSSVYTVGVGGDINSSGGSYLAYVFAEVDGFSKISSYTGNGSTDGPFVYTGFKPSWVMLKRITGSTQEWQIYDAARDPYNLANHKLEANSSSAESVLTSDNNLDFLSNGFKLLQANGGMNASGSEYLYMAFAECPFKTANARGITTNGT